MLKPKKFPLSLSLSLSLSLFFLVFPSLFAQETITITTYYPSPYGSYGYLHTDKFGVGDNDGSGGPTEADIPITSGNVWIAGNVGIGTTGPLTSLVVSKNLTATTFGDAAARFTGTTYGLGRFYGIGFDYDANHTNQPVALGYVPTLGTAFTNGALVFATRAETTDTAPSERMRIDSAGNVGIGTTDTTTGGFNNKAVIKQGGDGNWRGLGIEGNASGGHVLSIDYLGSNTFGIYTSYRAAPAAYSDIAFGPGGSEKVRFTTGGNVGIGTTGPTTPLTVKGKIRSVRSDGTSYADYTAEAGVALLDSSSGYFYFVRGGTGNYATGTTMMMDNSGNVGIGTVSPVAKLHVQQPSGTQIGRAYISVGDGWSGFEAGSATSGTSWFFGPHHPGTYGITSDWSLSYHNGTSWSGQYLSVASGGNVGIATTTPGYTLTVNGTAWCTSGAWTGSDIRWKENIKTLPDETLNKVLKLRGVSFDWKREEFKGNNFPEGRQIGLIAQEMEKEFPELVTTDKEGYKAIAYDRFTAVLLEAIKQLKSQNDALKARIEALEKKL